MARGRFARWAVPVFFLAFATTLAELSWWTVFNLRNVRAQTQAQQALLHRDAQLAHNLLAQSLADAVAHGEPRAQALERLRAQLRPLFSDLAFAPGSELAVAPDPWVLQTLVHTGAAHVRMFVAEGSFFALMMVLGGGLIYRALRHEMEVVRQGQNFLAAVTHELRSPLASMRLWVETLQRRPAGNQAGLSRPLAILLRDIERLETLVANVLTAARLDAGRRRGKPLAPTLQAVPPLDLVAASWAVVQQVRAHAEAKGVALSFSGAGSVWARIDAAAFELVVRNLLDNAIKYSAGAPKVDIAVVARDMRVQLWVTDQGTGLAPAELLPIFDKFYRVGDEMVRGSAGTGLGLFLVRAVVQEHAGEVVATSPGPGCGSTFVVSLPAAEQG